MFVPAELLNFWFTTLKPSPDWFAGRIALWFGAHPEIDEEVTNRFLAPLLEATPSAPLTARDKLAWILLWDQVPRNIWRGEAKMLDRDGDALALAESFSKTELATLHPIEQCFVWFVYQHHEDITHQQTQLDGFCHLLETATVESKPFLKVCVRQAHRHFEMIQRFGRFPHRNPMLNRQSTVEEQRFIDNPDYNFLLPVRSVK